jgi:hypothetical protein
MWQNTRNRVSGATAIEESGDLSVLATDVQLDRWLG